MLILYIVVSLLKRQKLIYVGRVKQIDLLRHNAHLL
jgi:hypothetical protein